jgi:6-pyruvoyltetrahydropterin/6-carboxytetrahydropterin synthase
MFRLTREVRFALNIGREADPQLHDAPTNSYGGYPSLNGLGLFCTARVTLAGELDPQTQYLINIKEIDGALRAELPQIARLFREQALTPVRLLGFLHERCRQRWPDRLDAIELVLSPFQSWSLHHSEFPMLRLSQKFEFSASHRLHSPALSDEANRACYGKCNNPHGHGHNYEVQVTLRGEPRAADGVLVDVPAFERIVAETVIQRFDHKNLNLEVPEFAELVPSVENIARVIYRLLKPRFGDERATLAAVTVWETPKTWCEYSE